MTIIDHNIEGQALRLLDTLKSAGWFELIHVEMVMFRHIDLPIDINDRLLWHFVQQHRMILLTANRNMEDENSLEYTLREENQPFSFPVITTANVDRLDERIYRERCAERLLEIVLYLDNYLGAARIYIP